MAGRGRKLAWIVGTIAAVVVVLAVAVWWWARPAEPTDFYSQPAELPSEPGQVLRSQDFAKDVPAGADAHLILYTTTDDTGKVRVATATVLVPTAKGDGPYPVLAWAHATTGVVRGCAPSLLPDPWGGMPEPEAAVEAGYVVVATDYVGLGTPGPHQYLVGDTAGRNVLDSVRALRAFDQDEDVTHGQGLTDEVVVWGHSQGAQTALFTGQIAPDYAPDVDLVGVAGLAPPTDLEALLAVEQDTLFGKVLSALAVDSWSKVYDDLSFDSLVRPAAQPAARDIASRCLTYPKGLATVAEGEALRKSIFRVDPSTYPPLVAHMEENSAGTPIAAPVFIGQGDEDTIVDPKVTADYVAARCQAGQTLDFWRFPDITHFTIVTKGTPAEEPLLAWTADRFAGEPAPEGCQDHGS